MASSTQIAARRLGDSMADHFSAQTTLVKKDLVEDLARELDVTKALAQSAVQRVLDRVAAHVVAGGRVEFRGHFVLEVREQSPRVVRNPRTGEEVNLPGRRVVRFRPGRRMRRALARVGESKQHAQRNGQVKPSPPPALRIVGVAPPAPASRFQPGARPGQRIGAS